MEANTTSSSSSSSLPFFRFFSSFQSYSPSTSPSGSPFSFPSASSFPPPPHSSHPLVLKIQHQFGISLFFYLFFYISLLHNEMSDGKAAKFNEKMVFAAIYFPQEDSRYDAHQPAAEQRRWNREEQPYGTRNLYPDLHHLLGTHTELDLNLREKANFLEKKRGKEDEDATKLQDLPEITKNAAIFLEKEMKRDSFINKKLCLRKRRNTGERTNLRRERLETHMNLWKMAVLPAPTISNLSKSNIFMEKEGYGYQKSLKKKILPIVWKKTIDEEKKFFLQKSDDEMRSMNSSWRSSSSSSFSASSSFSLSSSSEMMKILAFLRIDLLGNGRRRTFPRKMSKFIGKVLSLPQSVALAEVNEAVPADQLGKNRIFANSFAVLKNFRKNWRFHAGIVATPMLLGGLIYGIFSSEIMRDKHKFAIVETPEDERQLHKYICAGCGYTMLPAKGREKIFFYKDFKCPCCSASSAAFYDANNPDDSLNHMHKKSEQKLKVDEKDKSQKT